MDLEDKIIQATLAILGPGGHSDTAILYAAHVTDIVLDHMQEAVDYWTAETTYLQQRVEELEIDLMLEQEGFRLEDSHTIKPKRRTNFK